MATVSLKKAEIAELLTAAGNWLIGLNDDLTSAQDALDYCAEIGDDCDMDDATKRLYREDITRLEAEMNALNAARDKLSAARLRPSRPSRLR